MHPNLHWDSLFNADGDWCGTVLLDKFWIENGDLALDARMYYNEVPQDCSAPDFKSTVHEFMAISEARDFSAEEHDSWTYYVPMDRVDSQWDLYYVLLIVTDKHGISKRREIGKIFKDAFKKSHKPGYSWKEFMMG